MNRLRYRQQLGKVQWAFDSPNLTFTDSNHNLLKQLMLSGEVTVFSGNTELKTASGKSSSSSHAQPAGIATERHMIYVCDKVITPTSKMAGYLLGEHAKDVPGVFCSF